MFKQALRLLATGEAARRVGESVQNTITKYLVLSLAGAVFGGALTFATLASFWAILARTNDPVQSASIMGGILALVGFLIVFIAYGSTKQKPLPSARVALENPIDTARANIPAVDDVGREIEKAVATYGPLKVAGAALGAGLLVGFLAKKTKQI